MTYETLQKLVEHAAQIYMALPCDHSVAPDAYRVWDTLEKELTQIETAAAKFGGGS